MIKNIIYPGTFDPITHGHVDIIRRALKISDKVIVAVAANRNKTPLFSLEERVQLAREVLAPLNNVEVEGFDTLLIDFAKQKKVDTVLRGLRVVADFEYEFQLVGMNRKLNPDIETIFLMPTENHAYISSAFVREVAQLGGDVSFCVHPQVLKALQAKFA